MAGLVELLTTIPGWMVVLMLVAVLTMVAGFLALLYGLLRPLARRLGRAKRVSVGIAGANIELPDDDDPTDRE